MNWSQLQTILWLRWRLTRNQWTRAGAVSAALTVIAMVVAVGIAIGSVVGGVLGGTVGLAKASPNILLVVWDVIIGVFLFAWLIGLMTEIQRSETIDLARLLHLPVSLKGIFLINYLASHLSFVLLLFLPGMLGLCAGLTLSRGPAMLLMFPLVLGFVFMITAWTYCLRGWLIALMVNQRRRRTIIMCVTLSAILLGQLPNLLINVIGRRHRTQSNPGQPAAQQPQNEKPALPPAFVTAQQFIPVLWPANGAAALITGSAWPAVWGSLGAFGIAALGLRRAYRSTVRFYQGAQSKSAAKKPPAARRMAKTGQQQFLGRRVPGVSDDTGALALAFLRSLSRAPEVKMMLAANAIMPLIIVAMVVSRGVGAPGETLRPFLATAAVAFTFLSTVGVLFNQFGFDREGFRALVLLPTPRWQILLAKNLAMLPVASGMGLLLLMLVAVLFHVPVLAVLAAGCQLCAAFLFLSIAGNFLSVMVPYRVAAGSLRPTKSSAKTVAVVFASQLLFPIAIAPIFLPPAMGLLAERLAGFSSGGVNALLSLLWLAVVALLYRLSLRSLGNLLLRREKDILKAVTVEVE